MKTKGYYGWKNWETWNVSLWLGNDEGLYRLSKGFTSYEALAECLAAEGMSQTPDGASFTDSGLDIKALNRMLQDQ